MDLLVLLGVALAFAGALYFRKKIPLIKRQSSRIGTDGLPRYRSNHNNVSAFFFCVGSLIILFPGIFIPRTTLPDSVENVVNIAITTILAVTVAIIFSDSMSSGKKALAAFISGILCGTVLIINR